MTVATDLRHTPAGWPILSGALHYFRVHPDQWQHRIRMCRAMGLTTIETYVPWNLHQPRPDVTDFSGRADLGAFLDLVAKEGMHAIVRPGPYICAEWDNGGIPSWVTADRSMTIRTSDARWQSAIAEWFQILMPVIVQSQHENGGAVILVQVENEYGSFGSDAAYLGWLAAVLRDMGVTVPLFTSDGPTPLMLTGGSIPNVATTVNFGSDPEEAFGQQRSFRPTDAPFCMEFWDGWFDHWGTPRHTRDPHDVADTVDRILASGASLNFYMAHGGSNFGTGAGANRSGDLHDGDYQPTVTSYDYHAPIDESGRATEAFFLVREVIARRTGLTPPEIPGAPATLPTSTVTLDVVGSYTDLVFDGAGTHPIPPTFEAIDFDHGLVRYDATLPGPRPELPLVVTGVADRAHLLIDGSFSRTLAAGDHTVPLATTDPSTRITLIVESMGRVNYGPRVGEHKGITGAVRHERQLVHDWTVSSLSVAHPPALPAGPPGPVQPGLPVVLRGTIETTAPGDAIIDLRGFSKGYVWIGDELLGRYWNVGPTQGLFLPGGMLTRGATQITILDLDGTVAPTLTLWPGSGGCFDLPTRLDEGVRP